jgi:hypothetical protein
MRTAAETATSPPRRAAARRDGRPIDCAFLAAITAASFVPYVGRLGFYSDDWALLGSLHSFGDFSNAGRSTVFVFHDMIWQRPTQAVYTWLLFRLFGLHPIGYHLTNAVVVVAMVVLLYLVLRELGMGRPVALSVAAVYSMVPIYSTDRFWLAAFGYGLTMAAFLLSLFAGVRSLRSAPPGRWWWKAVALSALLVAALGYEVVLPFLVVDVLALWWLARRLAPAVSAPAPAGARLVLFLGADVAVLAGVLAYKVVAAVQTGVPTDYPKYVLWLLTGTLVTNLGTYGLDLPRVTWWAVRSTGWPSILAGGGIGVATLAVVRRAAVGSDLWSIRSRDWIRLAAAGLATLLAGYAIFLFVARILFTSTGINNRVSIAGAIGSAAVLVAACGIVARLAGRRPAWRASIFAALVGAVCLSGAITNAALADRWADAWQRQRAVLADVRAHVPRPAPRSAVILDGVCPYVGPAIVFESNWDLAGALEVLYGDPTIRADVTSANLRVGRDGLTTTLYGDHVARYRYGPSLILFDPATSTVRRLTDETTARALLRDPDAGCPAGAAGSGVPIFELDGWFHRLELRYFWR